MHIFGHTDMNNRVMQIRLDVVHRKKTFARTRWSSDFIAEEPLIL